MLERLSGDKGKRLRVEAFADQKIVSGNRALALELSELAELIEFKNGASAVEQGAPEALLAQGGLFARTARMQSAEGEEEAE